MPRLNLISQPQPVLGIIVVSAGWALSHQWGSNAVLDDCVASGGPTVVLVSLLGLVVIAAGAAYSYLGWQASSGAGRRFLGAIGALLAIVAAFAVVLQIVAGLILPPCAA